MTTTSLNCSHDATLGWESTWLLCKRFLYRNQLRASELRDVIRHQGTASTSLGEVSLSHIRPYVRLNDREFVEAQPKTWEFVQPVDRDQRFKFCTECAAFGYHSVLHELSWLERCPIHSIELISQCETCQKSLTRQFPGYVGQSANTLACGHVWTQANVLDTPQLEIGQIAELGTWLRVIRERAVDESWRLILFVPPNYPVVLSRYYPELLELVSRVVPPSDAIHRLLPRPAERSGKLKTSESYPRENWFETCLQDLEGKLAAARVANKPDLEYDLRLFSSRFEFRKLGKDGIRDLVDRFAKSFGLFDQFADGLKLSSSELEFASYGFFRRYLDAEWPGKRASGRWTYGHLRRLIVWVGRPLGLIVRQRGATKLHWVSLNSEVTLPIETNKRVE